MDTRSKLDEFFKLRGWNKNKLIGWSEAADFGDWIIKNANMKKNTYKYCPECGNEYLSLGYANHMAMHRRNRERSKKWLNMKTNFNLKSSQYHSGYSYLGKHIPSGEDWYIIGIDVDGDRVCVAGWPATIGKLSDCSNLEIYKPLTDEELAHRKDKFGKNWL